MPFSNLIPVTEYIFYKLITWILGKISIYKVTVGAVRFIKGAIFPFELQQSGESKEAQNAF